MFISTRWYAGDGYPCQILTEDGLLPRSTVELERLFVMVDRRPSTS